MDLVVLICGIAFLFVSIIFFKLNAVLALLLASLLVGLLQGMPLLDIVASIEGGLGGTLGHLGIIIGLGAIFGRLLSDGGGAQRIATTLVDKIGTKYVEWAISFASLVLGITLFWEVSVVLLIPMVFTVAMKANVSIVRVGIPMLASTGVAHAFLPPHPGATLAATTFGADIGTVILYGLIIGVPIAIISGPIYAKLFKKINPEIPQQLVTTEPIPEEELPGFGISLITALSPVIIILLGVIGNGLFEEGSIPYIILANISNADIALLIAVFIAVYVFGLRGKRKTMTEVMDNVQSSLVGIGCIVFIIGAGGSFKQVILDSGMADYVGDLMGGLNMSPYLLAFLVGCVIRCAVGSATVTIVTTAALVMPLMGPGVSPEIMTLVMGAASCVVGPPNDAGFWMIKEFFNLKIGDTVKIWCGMCTLNGILGFAGAMVLSMFV